MRKKICFFLVIILLFNLILVGSVWAKPKFIPPGLAKKHYLYFCDSEYEYDEDEFENEFKDELKKWYEYKFREKYDKEFKDLIKNKLKGEIEGKIVYADIIDDAKWIVVKGDKSLKSLTFLKDSWDKYEVGDWVKVEYLGNKILEIKFTKDDDKDDEDDEDELRYRLNIYTDKFEIGEDFVFNLEIYNRDDKKITKQINSGQIFDFIVKRNGKEVWQWSDNKNFVQVIQYLTIDAKEKLNYSAVWEPEDEGYYTVEAYFMAESKTSPVAVKSFYIND